MPRRRRVAPVRSSGPVKHALRRTGRSAPAVCAFFRLDYDGGLHESEHLAAIVRSSDDAILSKDRNAIVTSWNEAAQRLYGYSADEIVGKPVATLIPPERRGEELEIVAKIFAGERVDQYDSERVRKDGTRIAVSLTASPIHDSNGAVVGVSTRARDRKAVEEELDRTRRNLERSNAELDQFAYVASHDLKEPLILLSAYARMLAERHGDDLDEEGRTFLRHVREEAGRMKAMIDDLLAYSRLQTSAEDTSRVALGEVLDTALRTLAPRLEETAAQVDVQGPLPVVEGSPAQFERLFRNLVGNAVKFRSEPPPAVTVSAIREEDSWIVSVRDNGIGVDPAKANRIFDVFQRLHGQEQYPGTGMGLAICKRIVERHGGRIWVEPAAGGGSTFKFSLPE